MSARTSARIRAMTTSGTQNLIERAYRESSQFQWVREMHVNAVEAGATRIEFGIEWQAVEEKGVYRRTIADNGCGMNSEQLVEFFNTFGGGGKPIGNAHENFGVGSKTSLLPWNTYGMVVVSWVDGDASMIWVQRDSETGEYGLKLEPCETPNGPSKEAVYDPYLDPVHGCDWAKVKPDWITDHGTVVILLGNSPSDHTVLGDPTRDEADIKGISSYLNRRMWEIPAKAEVYVDELRTSERANWPPDEATAHGSPAESGDKRTNKRKIEGAKYFVEYPNPRFTEGKLGSRGEVVLKDGTRIDWYLWDGTRPRVDSYAAISGYIATLYNDELYDISNHHATYRSFGISESSVRQRVWLVISPPVDPEGKRGVYPRTDRGSLLIKGGPGAGSSLPIRDWAAEFADAMPDELVKAIKEARQGDSGCITDKEWREKLAEKFGSRWRVQRLRIKPNGALSFSESAVGVPIMPLRKRKEKPIVPPTPKPNNDHDNPAPRSSRVLKRGKTGGTAEGELIKAPGGLPEYRTVGESEVGEGILAAWQPNDPEYPQGVVLLNVEHPVLRQVIDYWQAQYADHHADAIEHDVIDVYGQVAVSKVAHSEHLKTILPAHVVEEELRSEAALTMALLGLMAEDHIISTRIGGKYSKKRYATIDSRRSGNGTPK